MKYKLVGIGEVLWDLLPGGRQLGGAPANFAYHACALGAEARLISRVGKDADGAAIIERLGRLGISTECIEVDDDAPTGTVSVDVARDGQPKFTIDKDVAWDRIAGSERARRVAGGADALCFGTLAQRCETSRGTIQGLVAMAPRESWRILDVNLRERFYSREVVEQSLALANVLKLNESELPPLAEMFGCAGDERERIAQLAKRFGLRVIACTRGGNGSVLLADGRWSEHPGVPVKVVDTVGAGDAFTAAMAVGLLAGWELSAINRRANEVAAYVASRSGATPKLPEMLTKKPAPEGAGSEL